MRIACALMSSVGLSLTPSGCQSPERVIPDPSVPHRLSRDVDAYQWVRRPDGIDQEMPVRIPAGWWIASPQILTPPR